MIDRIKAERETYKAMLDNMQRTNSDLLAENKRLTLKLGRAINGIHYYANERNWSTREIQLFDRGDFARRVKNEI